MKLEQKSIELIFRDGSRQTELEPLCRKVLEKFQLPQSSLICIFDDVERPEFTGPSSYWENLCGLFLHVRQFCSGPVECPDALIEHVWKSGEFLCDVVIYLCCKTCQCPARTVIAFAHELQHFMQYGCKSKVYRANEHIFYISRKYKYDGLSLWNFPHEYQAYLRSKWVAEDVLGADEIRNHEEQEWLKLRVRPLPRKAIALSTPLFFKIETEAQAQNMGPLLQYPVGLRYEMSNSSPLAKSGYWRPPSESELVEVPLLEEGKRVTVLVNRI